MQFVYVLTTDFKNFFAEQCYISEYSLKKYNKDAEIITLVDQSTYSKISENSLLNKISKITKVDCPEKMSMKERSRYLKLVMRDKIEGDFLYIDSDTIICDALNEIFNSKSSVSQVIDLHIPFSKNIFLQSNVITKIKKAGLNYIPLNYFNSGVIFSKDDETSHDFFNKALQIWESYENKDFCIDQPAFNYANFLMNNFISELDGIWNCQITENGLRFLHNAKIIHYFATTNNSTFLLAHNDILESVRTTNDITPELDLRISNAKNMFTENAIILSSTEKIAVYNSNFFRISSFIYKKMKFLFKFIDFCFSFIHK